MSCDTGVESKAQTASDFFLDTLTLGQQKANAVGHQMVCPATTRSTVPVAVWQRSFGCFHMGLMWQSFGDHVTTLLRFERQAWLRLALRLALREHDYFTPHYECLRCHVPVFGYTWYCNLTTAPSAGMKEEGQATALLVRNAAAHAGQIKQELAAIIKVSTGNLESQLSGFLPWLISNT